MLLALVLLALLSAPCLPADRASQQAALSAALDMRNLITAAGLEYDTLPENWTAVTSAIQEGCQHFTIGVSRIEYRGRRIHYLYRVLPLHAPPSASGYLIPWDTRPQPASQPR